MKKLFVAGMLAVVLAGSTAFALDSVRAVEGRVQSVDPAGKSITLVGGMTFVVPSNISTETLQTDEEVTITYLDGRDGQKQLTGFWIESGPGGRG